MVETLDLVNDELNVLREKIEKHKKNTQKASLTYYYKNYVVREDMTDEEKERVQKNIEKRRERERKKYETNKDYHREKNKRWRDKKAKSK